MVFPGKSHSDVCLLAFWECQACIIASTTFNILTKNNITCGEKRSTKLYRRTWISGTTFSGKKCLKLEGYLCLFLPRLAKFSCNWLVMALGKVSQEGFYFIFQLSGMTLPESSDWHKCACWTPNAFPSTHDVCTEKTQNSDSMKVYLVQCGSSHLAWLAFPNKHCIIVIARMKILFSTRIYMRMKIPFSTRIHLRTFLES
jgi:hypothetical protein